MNYEELRNGLVHADSGTGNDCTLCGVTTENTIGHWESYDKTRESETEPYMRETTKKITCTQCAQIILRCVRLGRRSIGKVQEGGVP